jgi:hypothetical protein
MGGRALPRCTLHRERWQPEAAAYLCQGLKAARVQAHAADAAGCCKSHRRVSVDDAPAACSGLQQGAQQRGPSPLLLLVACSLCCTTS